MEDDFQEQPQQPKKKQNQRQKKKPQIEVANSDSDSDEDDDDEEDVVSGSDAEEDDDEEEQGLLTFKVVYEFHLRMIQRRIWVALGKRVIADLCRHEIQLKKTTEIYDMIT